MSQRLVDARTLCVLLCALPHAAAAQNVAPIGTPDLRNDRPLPEQTVAQREQPDFSPAGLRVGGFILYPQLSIGQAIDDNIYASPTSTRSDFVTLVEPELRIESDWSVHRLVIDAAGSYQRYWEHNTESVLNGHLHAKGELDATTDWRLGAELGNYWDHEERGSWEDSAGAEPTPYQHRLAKLTSEYKGGRVGIDARLEYERFSFSDVPTSLGTDIDNSDRDRNVYTAQLRGAYEIVPNYDAFVRTTFDARQYDREVDDLGFRRSSYGWRAEAGVDIDLTGLIVGEVYAGYTNRTYDDDRFDNVSGLLIGANLYWNPTPLTTGWLKIDRRVSETTLGSSAGIMLSRASVGVDHELMRNLLLGGSAEISYGEYNGVDREDVVMALGAYVKYSMNRNVFMSADYSYTRRESTAAGADYDRNKFVAKVGYRF